MTSSVGEPVGDFYVHVINESNGRESELFPSGHFLRTAQKPSVIHFYDGG